MLMLCLSMIEDARDRFAFEDIFRSTEKDLVNYINTLVHNKNDAEDIAQEAWLCVSRNIESFRVNHYKSVKNYVFLLKNADLRPFSLFCHGNTANRLSRLRKPFSQFSGLFRIVDRCKISKQIRN